MTQPQQLPDKQVRRWAVWLGAVLLVPLTFTCAAMLYALYHSAVTGQLITVAKGYNRTSQSVRFAESPLWFVVLFVLQALVVLAIMAGTAVMARLVISRMRRN